MNMNIERFLVTPITETKLQSESLVIPYKLSEPIKLNNNNIIEMQAANYYRDIKELEKELAHQITFDRQQQLLLQKHILEQRALLINALVKLPDIDLPNTNNNINNNFIPKIYPSTNTLPTMKTIPVEITKSAMKPVTETVTTKPTMKQVVESVTTKPFNKHEYIMSEINQYKINQSKPTQAPCSILDTTSVINDLGLDTSAKSYCSMDKILDANLMNKIQLTKADSQSLKSIFSFNK